MLNVICSKVKQVHHSDLWNQQYIEDEYDPGFPPAFEELISKWTDGSHTP